MASKIQKIQIWGHQFVRRSDSEIIQMI